MRCEIICLVLFECCKKTILKEVKKTTFAGPTNNANEVSSKKRPTFSVSLAYKERWVRGASSCKNGHINFYVNLPVLTLFVPVLDFFSYLLLY